MENRDENVSRDIIEPRPEIHRLSPVRRSSAL